MRALREESFSICANFFLDRQSDFAGWIDLIFFFCPFFEFASLSFFGMISSSFSSIHNLISGMNTRTVEFRLRYTLQKVNSNFTIIVHYIPALLMGGHIHAAVHLVRLFTGVNKGCV